MTPQRAAITVDLAWAGGLFEGEGSIDFSRCTKAGTTYAYPRVQLSTTDEDVVRRFHSVLGHGRVNGPYRNAASTRPYWRWSAENRAARLALELLLPFLGERRNRRALEVLAR